MTEQTNWLQNLDDRTREAVVTYLDDVSLEAEEILFSQGDFGDSMYLVEDGRLDIWIRDPEGNDWLINHQSPGDVLGEMALLTGHKRVATAKAGKASKLKRLSKADFDALCDVYRTILPTFSSMLESRLQITQLVGVLSGLFGVLDYDSIQELQRRLIWKHVPSGTKLDYRDEPPGSMYIVVNGRLRADSVSQDSFEVPVREIGQGDTYGDFNLLSGENSEIVLTALRDTDIVRASQDVIEWLLQRNPQSVLKFVHRTSLRLQSQDGRRHQTSFSCNAIALLPLGPKQPVTELAERLVEKLTPYGQTLHLNSHLFDSLFGRERTAQTTMSDSNNIALNHWLTEQERAYTFVVYEADPAWTPWTRRCLRQADRIVLVSESDRAPEQGELETSLNRQGYPVDQELVLIHPDNAAFPKGTMAWLKNRNVKKFHHVRMGNGEDIGRLSRRLIGKEVGLVLSGGGARGFAHAGAFKALREANIPVDIIGGASMGALIGGILSQGNGYDDILTFADRYGSPRTVYDFTLPVVSFLASRKLTKMLDGVFAERRIEDMWRPFFCISADLSQATANIHRNGPAWEAVRGSVALPGIFAPFIFQKRVVVDGGVMNNFPIDVMRQQIPGGWIIGINVSPPREMERDFRFDSGVSGWQVLLDRLNPFGRRLKAPSIFSTLTRSVEVRGIYQMALVRDKADRIIQPNVARYNYLDFRPAREIAKAGYQATVDVIDELKLQFQEAGFRLE